MRLPSVMRLPSFHSKRNKSDGQRSRSVETNSSITASSSNKVLPDVKTSPGSDDKADTDSAIEKAGQREGEEEEEEEEEEEIKINPFEFFRSETWSNGQLELELGETSPTQPKKWLDDVEIMTDSRIEGVSAYECPSPTFRPLHSSVFDRLERLERAATVSTTQVLSSSQSLESFSSAEEAIIRIKSRFGSSRFKSLDDVKHDTQSDGEAGETDLERRRRRRRTYHVAHLSANPFFHAAGKGAKMRELQILQQELEESGMTLGENHLLQYAERLVKGK